MTETTKVDTMHIFPRNRYLIPALLAGMTLVGAACSRPSLPAATAPPPAAPAPSNPPAANASAFGSTQILVVGQSVSFVDGLGIELKKINDSRCPEEVQCIWAGELAPELTLHGGDVGDTEQTISLGLLRTKEHRVATYALTLTDASSDSATLVVTKPGVASAPNEDGVRVEMPLPGTSVQSPLTVSGAAPGSWYFEGSFPVVLHDGNGAVLAQANARAQSEWMGKAWVPFTATISFETPTTAAGELLLAKDNPSGEPGNAQESKIPLRFAAAAASRASGVRGVATIGPSCPVERMPPDPNCADRPQVATFSIDTPAGAHVATVTSAADGSFASKLPAGTYVIRLQSTAVMPSMVPQTFTVKAHGFTVLPLSLDSGIR